jgi:hypothetical protein|tara:strand:+ start:1451 stop:3007 length:1557 start_codon:yes stop_codon:yes gene_type:complete
MSPDLELTKQVREFYDDPLGYIMFVFPWDTDVLIQQVPLPEKYRKRFPNCEWGPDLWACEFLDDLGKQIRERKFDGRKSVAPIRFSTVSGHGIGKSVMVAWLILFLLDTRSMSKGVVTANTSDQLRTKTWPEVGKWHAIALTSRFWQYRTGRGSMSLSRISSKKATSNNWKCDAMTCREENAEAFQGLHAANSTPFYIFDEASGIPDSIWEARFGGATDGEPMSFDFGNGTQKSGYFFENCVGRYRHRFITRSIDSRQVHLTNKDLFEEWRQDWGEDSDLFKVKVRGMFPAQGNVQFISTDLVDDAMLRPNEHTKSDPFVIGVDVARFGENDTVIYPRIGMDARSFGYKRFNGLDVVQVVEKVIETLQEFQSLGRKCNGLFIDGGGLGGGVVDMLRRLGYNPIDVNFGGKAADRTYHRKGDEMWGRMKDAMPRLALPKEEDLKAQLTQREYGFSLSGQKIKLETKRDMSDRGVQSPDMADALSLTFAQEVNASPLDGLFASSAKLETQHEYDPLEIGK